MSQAALKTANEFAAEGHTPMMAQYHALKEQYPDCILFYRMGDFYEMFFDDAVKASECLDITLTKRGKNQENEIPMCGVPYHSYEPYLAKLIRSGFRVAICEQTETPEEAKKRGGYKALVNRDVIRIVTQGTLTEDTLLNARENNYLAAVCETAGQFGLSWLDLSTGEFYVQTADRADIPASLDRIGASELLLHDKLAAQEIFAQQKDVMTPQAGSLFDSQNAQKRLETLFGVGTIESFGSFSRAEIAAAGALVDYVARTQKGKMPHIFRPQQVSNGAVMDIDPATRRSLELVRTQTGERRGSLLACIDRTVTGAGARLLQSRLSAPLTDLAVIRRRHDEVETFIAASPLRENLREKLKSLPDMERALSRLTIGRGGPRDLGAVRDALAILETLRGILLATGGDILHKFARQLELDDACKTLKDTLAAALTEDLPFNDRDGGFIRSGYTADLDHLRGLRDESRRLIAALQARYREETDINLLKISYNNVLGYFIEVPSRFADKLMVKTGDAANPYIHRQSLANVARFTTPELSELERDIASAGEKSLALEQQFFTRFVQDVSNATEHLGALARAGADLDVACSLAELAQERGYTRPQMSDDYAFAIEGGRHPVVEASLAKDGGAFVPNDCSLNPAERLWLLTGPNMAGKSTFLRQNALIAILAQMGSFVPAASARIGIVDKCFSRVGASDDLARGRSTFMVEMVETATILNLATPRSLVILDEIGRGTATYDGLSIAWACVEYLHENSKCRAIFATHYHELTNLTTRLPALSCHSMQVREWNGEVIFLHAVQAGAADRSYGIHVARLAGLPKSVLDRAGEVLELLNKGEHSGALTRLADDLPLFSAAPPQKQAAADPKAEALKEKLTAINPDDLSARDALNMLYELKELLKN
ncbi:MAG: DNA mismatch repair protein MutS [Micavibrio aeruginosavorus]|uniref:DNA mismatch repair protein MutS n=1 Tax=Micavibrio aeruginosavorus TaxID=349221 RepID=A0A2W4ZR10_9BACT|nr:MAG: DNA mismatch repair protein MutS [Micavibrio aeruginosavorus]